MPIPYIHMPILQIMKTIQLWNMPGKLVAYHSPWNFMEILEIVC
jgi:hypothetical protein